MGALTIFAGAVKSRLKDAANTLLPDAAYQDAVSAAVLEYSHVSPRILKSSLTLVAGTADYAVPADFLSLRETSWGYVAPVQPWQSNPSTSFECSLVDGKIHFTPPPAETDIVRFGAVFNFIYRAAHQLDDANPSVNTLAVDGEQPVILKALALACAEIAADSTQSEEFVYRYRNLAKTYGEMYEELLKKKIRAAVIR